MNLATLVEESGNLGRKICQTRLKNLETLAEKRGNPGRKICHFRLKNLATLAEESDNLVEKWQIFSRAADDY